RLLPERGVAFKTTKKALLDGWQMSGINTFMSGAPLGVSLSLSSGNANNWSGSPTDASRPSIIANPVLPKSERTFDHNVNAAAFALPVQGTLGNAPKDAFRGPGINNWDISMFKNFRLTERFKAQFRGEGYNVFNHTQFSGVDTSIRFNNQTGALVSSTFGQYSSSRLPRRLQLALRITF